MSRVKALNEENLALYEELKRTREELAEAREIIAKMPREMQIGMFNILGDMKLLKDNKKYIELEDCIDENYEILKIELADDDQSEN